MIRNSNSKSLGMEFATAAFHNSYYFHKEDNYITNQEEVCNDFKTLIEWQLKEKHPKAWFRAYFNMGLINYIHDILCQNHRFFHGVHHFLVQATQYLYVFRY